MNQDVKNFEIVVDDGSVRVPIKSSTSGEEIGVFSFRPTDMGMVERYNEVIKGFDDIVKPLEEVDIKSDGTAEDNDQVNVEALKDAERRLYEACDYLFGGNMSEAFFGKLHPFSPVGGVFYCEVAINAVGKFIEQQFSTEVKKANSRMAKYTGKYSKGSKK